MFTGIIEATAIIEKIEVSGENINFTLKCPFTQQLKIDQSLAHNGCCLTVVEITDQNYSVTAIAETLEKTNLNQWKLGTEVNLERCLRFDGRLDGHIVQGHVDQTAVCTEVKEADGSWYFTFAYDFDKEMAKRGYMTVDKGSVTVNGVSLTVCNPTDNSFQVAIIPYTYEHTNFHQIQVGSVVIIEFDIIGKYVSRMMSFQLVRPFLVFFPKHKSILCCYTQDNVKFFYEETQKANKRNFF